MVRVLHSMQLNYNYLSTLDAVYQETIIIVQFKVTMISKNLKVCAPCLPVLLLLYSSFLFVCFVG